MTTLYATSNEYLALSEKLSTMDLDAETIADTIEASGIVDEFTTKAQAILHIAGESERFCEAIDTEIERLQKLKSNRVKIGQKLREYLLTEMERSGIKTATCPLFELSINLNPPSVEIVDTTKLPAAYWRRPPPPAAVPNKVAIKTALIAGTEIPGAKLVQTSRLVIR